MLCVVVLSFVIRIVCRHALVWIGLAFQPELSQYLMLSWVCQSVGPSKFADRSANLETGRVRKILKKGRETHRCPRFVACRAEDSVTHISWCMCVRE